MPRKSLIRKEVKAGGGALTQRARIILTHYANPLNNTAGVQVRRKDTALHSGLGYFKTQETSFSKEL